MAEVSSSSFSEVDGSNNSAAPNGYPEGMAMSGLNDSGRGVMGAVKRFWGRINGRYASTGSSNAYVVTPDVALAAYVTGERYSFRASFANSGSCTLNISGLGAKTLKKYTGSGTATLVSGDIVSGLPVTAEYDGTDMIVVTPLAGTPTTPGTGISISGGAVSFNPNGLSGVTPATGDSLALADASDSNNPKKATIADVINAGAGVAKAWVAFNGTGTPAILASHNVASITDNGTGDYTINFTTAFASADYAAIGFCDLNTSDGSTMFTNIKTRATGSLRITTNDSTSVAQDPVYVVVFIFGAQ